MGDRPLPRQPAEVRELESRVRLFRKAPVQRTVLNNSRDELRFVAFLVARHVTFLASRSVIVARTAVWRIRSTVSRDRCCFVSRCNGAPCLPRGCS
jgi:hypothetical protein